MSTSFTDKQKLDNDVNEVAPLESVNPQSAGGIGSWFLRDMWYFALPSSALKKGKMVPKTMLNEPILLGRDQAGKAFAMRDICPHQAVPLSDGVFDGKEIMCCFHGWRFDTSGTCTAIPSLVDEQEFPVCKVKTKSYPVREVHGTIWVYFGDESESLLPVPEAPGLGESLYEHTTNNLSVPIHIDYAALALIDPAHVPYVHKSWWWRSAKALKAKQKHYVPSANGWTMVKHQPAKHSIIFKLFGQFIETEISFCLPGCRREYITFCGRTILSGISTLTPIDDTHTELNHTTYWMLPGTSFVTPVIRYFVNEFLGQDVDIAKKQATRLSYKPKLIPTIKDAGTPGAWYLLLKKEWHDSRKEKRSFANPVPDSILRWRS
ncbi:MAG: aromatic ring-hydroxylating dioxygenase subunit alpha [Candidatus Obscuribacterales bacterium]|nr:aromatic ring-hydroxylating dioxygenase subunit alpha [Candidatus Obscuribacterales bacterium]